ncbi:S-protein homolog 7 [Linum perenne]
MVNTITIPRVHLLILVITIAALTTTTTSARSLWPYKHVHVSNELKTYNGILHVHCWSKDDDLGNHDVGVGAEYTWRFRPSVLGTTKWTCEVSTDDHRRAEFDSYWEDLGQGKIEYKENIFWVAEEDGVYLRIIQENRDEIWAKWGK